MDHITRFLSLSTVLLMLCVYSSQGLQCFQCNSLYNETCMDPFNKTSPEQRVYLDNCSAEATYCRKMDQMVNGELRIIRQCGIAASPMECKEKVESKHVRANFCSCEDDQCNGGLRLTNIGLVLQIVAASLLSYLVSSNIKI